MMALNEESLFKRNICSYGPTTMRSTICYCMLHLADIKPGDIVIDSMCGGGSIPIEGANAWKHAHFLGGDNHEMAMERCKQNWVGNLYKWIFGSILYFSLPTLVPRVQTVTSSLGMPRNFHFVTIQLTL